MRHFFVSKNGKTPIRNWVIPSLDLKYGEYLHYLFGPNITHIVSEELKNLFVQYVHDDSLIEFLPVNIISPEYGNKTYYIVNFNRACDVIDKNVTVYVPGTDSIIKVGLDYQKVKNLDVFNAHPYGNDLIISEKVKSEMRKRKLISGVEFLPLYCGNYGESDL